MSQLTPQRRPARTFTVLGLLALFVVAVVAVLLRRVLPGRGLLRRR
jgi:hypothetical protein